MTRDTFFKHFDLLADQPDAVAKMRKLVLQLAVQGCLVPHSITEPAIPYASAEKAIPINTQQIPANWRVVLLSDAIKNRSGNSKLIKGKLYDAPTSGLFQGFSASGPDVWCEEFEHEGEAIIISAVGARCGKAFKANGKWSAIANTNITRAEPTLLEFDFAYLILNNEEFWVRGGSAQPFVKFPPSLSRHFALPPLAEQRRIVAKVDELMALCDELEQRQQARQHARAHLTQSAYHHLTAAKDPTDFRHRFNFILHKASFILDDVPQLRQAILQLAVQGRLFTKGERRAANGFDEMPDGWRSVKLGEVAEHRLGKMLDQQKNSGTPRPYLRNTNVHWFRFELDSIKELRLEDTELETYTLRKGDVLICEGGHGIGRTAVWSGEIPEMVFQKALHRVRPGKQLDSHFFAFCMKVYADTGILENYYTGAGIPHFTGQSLAKLSFPLPPLAEQKRIVARVEELLRWCDMLEAQLHQTRTLGAHLLDSFVERMKEEG